MELRRLLPYVAALLLLAFALGSLASSQIGGGLLLNSYWLLYTIYLLPIIALAALIVITVLAAYFWRDLSDAIGFGLARRKKTGKRKRLSTIITLSAWAFAIAYLLNTCGGIPCKSKAVSTSEALNTLVAGTSNSPLPPSLGSVPNVIGNIMNTEWFGYALFGLIIVSSIIILRAVKVSFDESKNRGAIPLPSPGEEATMAVQEAIKIVDDQETSDPRMKIIRCYQRMVRAASDMGAPISQDQTARELELGIRKTLMLRGQAIRDLTQLFEEARYSLHPMSSDDSGRAHDFLDSIAQELNLQTNIEA